MFGNPKCGHCDKIGTKLMQIEPTGSRFKQTAICCNHCNSILGVTDYYDSGTLLKKAEEERAALTKKVQRLEYSIDQIAQALSRR